MDHFFRIVATHVRKAANDHSVVLHHVHNIKTCRWFSVLFSLSNLAMRSSSALPQSLLQFMNVVFDFVASLNIILEIAVVGRLVSIFFISIY